MNAIKEKLKKIADVCKLIFGYGIMITVFAGGATFFGYLIALCVGGDVAVKICHFIYKELFPIIIYATTALVLFGVFAMYLAGEKSLVPEKRKKVIHSEENR